MSRVCQVSGKATRVANHVSHANNKTKRRQRPNIVKKRLWSAKSKRFITVKLCTKALRTVNKKGVDAVIDTIEH